jgi:hypothetical protein
MFIGNMFTKLLNVKWNDWDEHLHNIIYLLYGILNYHYSYPILIGMETFPPMPNVHFAIILTNQATIIDSAKAFTFHITELEKLEENHLEVVDFMNATQ